jgi:hypothetical protein
MLIRISGKVFVYDGDEERIRSKSRLEKLAGIEYKEDDFTNYMPAELRDLVERGGYISIVKHARDGKLRCVTEYRTVRSPTEAELNALVKYTTGQWSDGIGSSFHDWSLEKYGCAIDCSLMSDDFMTIYDPEVEQLEA